VPPRSRQKSENAKKTIKTRRRKYIILAQALTQFITDPCWRASSLVAGLLVILVGVGLCATAGRALIS